MASFKLRNKMFFPTSLKVGTNGSEMTKVLYGVSSACVPAMNASAVGTGSILITGVEVGDTVILQLASLGASGIGLVQTKAITNGASMTFMALVGPTTASTMGFNYMVLG